MTTTTFPPATIHTSELPRAPGYQSYSSANNLFDSVRPGSFLFATNTSTEKSITSSKQYKPSPNITFNTIEPSVQKRGPASHPLPPSPYADHDNTAPHVSVQYGPVPPSAALRGHPAIHHQDVDHDSSSQGSDGARRARLSEVVMSVNVTSPINTALPDAPHRRSSEILSRKSNVNLDHETGKPYSDAVEDEAEMALRLGQFKAPKRKPPKIIPPTKRYTPPPAPPPPEPIHPFVLALSDDGSTCSIDTNATIDEDILRQIYRDMDVTHSDNVTKSQFCEGLRKNGVFTNLTDDVVGVLYENFCASEKIDEAEALPDEYAMTGFDYSEFSGQYRSISAMMRKRYGQKWPRRWYNAMYRLIIKRLAERKKSKLSHVKRVYAQKRAASEQPGEV